MQLLPNAEPKRPSIIKRQPSRGLQLRFYSHVAVVVSTCPSYQLLRHRVSNKICENASFNKTNHNRQMPFAAKFIIPPAYGSDHSTVVLTSNKSHHATAVCSTTLMSGYVSVPIVSSAPGARRVFRPSQHDIGCKGNLVPPPPLSWATVLSQAFFTLNSRYRASLPYYIML